MLAGLIGKKIIFNLAMTGISVADKPTFFGEGHTEVDLRAYHLQGMPQSFDFQFFKEGLLILPGVGFGL
jgi:hypothetical protein